jgi:7-cyano-7-deazaguanine synthase
MTSKALVVLSGGQDSTTCLFWATARFEEVHAITFDYGQRHRIEIAAACKVAQLAGVADRHEICVVGGDILQGSSPLTSGAELEQYTDAAQMEATIGDRREKTFVPMRNALFLTIAANRAEVLGIDTIVTGVCQMDNANYDDCRQMFIDAAAGYINTALGHDHRGTPAIRILTPLMDMSKAETVRMAFKNHECWNAMAYTHTSYDGKYPPTDMNHANVLRDAGFREAELPDPLVVRAWAEGLMSLPDWVDRNAAARLAGWLKLGGKIDPQSTTQK